MRVARTMSRGSLSIVLAALILASAILVNTFHSARGDAHDRTYYACLFAGALTQVGTTQPANCGRGEQVQWTSATPYEGPQMNVRRTNFFVLANEIQDVFVDCLDGEVATGGGATIDNSHIYLETSYPQPHSLEPSEAAGWRARYNSYLSGGEGGIATVFAVCVDWTP